MNRNSFWRRETFSNYPFPIMCRTQHMAELRRARLYGVAVKGRLDISSLSYSGDSCPIRAGSLGGAAVQKLYFPPYLNIRVYLLKKLLIRIYFSHFFFFLNSFFFTIQELSLFKHHPNQGANTQAGG